VAFHYSSYGTFCVHSKSSIISTVVLPTTEIIEPNFSSLTTVDKELKKLCNFYSDFAGYRIYRDDS
ncbi:hypothetical protein, partial [Streptococcus vestibularis]|uniref:hypothetical protein n=1 Tax=Streptococcus vestibularis TaxID=1343 RepID=UPI002901D266